MGIWKDLIGTIPNLFRVGLTGITLKSLAGRLEIRNNSDSAFEEIAAARVDITGDTLVLASEGANTLTLRRNAAQAAPVSWTFPPTAGTAGQVWGTDGAGNITFVSLAGGADKEAVDTTTLNSGDTSPKLMFTLPASAVVNKVRVTIDIAFNGNPTLSIGVNGGSASKYLATTQVDLKQAATTVFETYPGIAPNASTETIQASYAAGGATAGSARLEIFYANPS